MNRKDYPYEAEHLLAGNVSAVVREPLLLGQDPYRSEHLWQLFSRGGFFPARHAVSAAISAVDRHEYIRVGRV